MHKKRSKNFTQKNEKIFIARVKNSCNFLFSALYYTQRWLKVVWDYIISHKITLNFP